MDISNKNINNRSCRTCLQENIDPLVSIFNDKLKTISGDDVNIRDVIAETTSVEVIHSNAISRQNFFKYTKFQISAEEDSELPKHICDSCLNILTSAFKFRYQVKMIEIQLNDFIQSKEIELIEITVEEEQTIQNSFEQIDVLESSENLNICNFCKKTFCNEKYLQIHISKQHKFL